MVCVPSRPRPVILSLTIPCLVHFAGEAADNPSCVLASNRNRVMKNWIYLAFGLTVCGCAKQQPQIDPAKETSQGGHSAYASRAQVLIVELNELERKYGNRVRRDPNYDVPGEVVARMQLLEEELRSVGYKAVWHRSSEYRLEHLK